jgi:Na+/H+ antiporter NhaD/arsenite permease-like protein
LTNETDLIVLFPFQIPIYVPRPLWEAFLNALSSWRIRDRSEVNPQDAQSLRTGRLTVDRKGIHFKKDAAGPTVRFLFWLDFVTAPLIADLFLLAVTAIGKKEVHDGTIGTAGISPLDVMGFFFSLAYIAISIDASGLIRFLACRVLELGGGRGRLLFFYLYTFFFVLTGFVGNDPVILSGTAFLAYMTRVSGNIKHPRAWIHAQFAVANIGSAILVSANPTNLVLASAFSIKFVHYTYNMIVPVVITAIVLFPFLLWGLWNDDALIPHKITMIRLQQLPPEEEEKAPVNPNVYHSKAPPRPKDDDEVTDEQLKAILRPFIDWKGAAMGAFIMAGVLIALLVINAESGDKHYPVFYVTLPGAFLLFCWDFSYGWYNRKDTRRAARELRDEDEARIANTRQASMKDNEKTNGTSLPSSSVKNDDDITSRLPAETDDISTAGPDTTSSEVQLPETSSKPTPVPGLDYEPEMQRGTQMRRETLVSRLKELYFYMQGTWPTVTEVISILPYPLLPFALSMFVLVQGLATKGWIPVFAYGWDHWVNKTGTIGAIGGMGFLSVVLCNVSSRIALDLHQLIITFVSVRRHKYRYHHSSLPCHSSLASYSPSEWTTYFGSEFLGDGLLHGNRRKLWCI